MPSTIVVPSVPHTGAGNLSLAQVHKLEEALNAGLFGRKPLNLSPFQLAPSDKRPPSIAQRTSGFDKVAVYKLTAADIGAQGNATFYASRMQNRGGNDNMALFDTAGKMISYGEVKDDPFPGFTWNTQLGG